MRLRVADGVGVEVAEEVVYAAHLPDGPIIVLEGIAALIWNEACEVRRETVAEAVAARTGQDVAAIRRHVDGFLDGMLARGMLAVG